MFEFKKKKTVSSQSNPSSGKAVVPVKLKSYFGIHPFLCYLIKVFLIFIAISIVPSIFTNRRRLYISTNPFPLEIRVDGQSIGRSPRDLKLSPGKHLVEVFCFDNKLSSQEVKIRPSLFLSYIFEYSKHINIDVNLSATDVYNIEKYILSGLQRDSLKYNVDNKFPQEDIFSIAKNLLENYDLNFLENLKEFSPYFISNEFLKDDFKKAFSCDYSSFLAQKNLQPSKNFYIKEKSLDKKENFVSKKKIADLDFVETDSYFIQQSPVSKELFKNFLDENPKYRKENIENLIKENIVDDLYLSTFSDAEYYVSSVPINVVDEFLSWFNSKYELKARLASKQEYVSFYNLKDELNSFENGFYEFCSSSFIPYEALFLHERLSSQLRHKIISFFKNYSLDLDYELFCFSRYTRSLSSSEKLDLVGFSDKKTSSPFVGFRLVIDK